MAKFQYKLQSVLDIKQKLESQEKIAFGLASAKLLEEQEILQKLMIQKAGYDKQAESFWKERLTCLQSMPAGKRLKR